MREIKHGRSGRISRRTALAAGGIATALCGAALSACGSGSSGSAGDPPTVRIGYLTNLTHAPALLGVSRGYFKAHLPAGTTLITKTFSAGPAENEALLGGSLDAAFVGPSPAINAFTSTHGGVVIVAGVASGGAGFVVSPAIAQGNFPADLRGKVVASPQLGNTQDVSLRTWLNAHGLRTSVNGGGDVTIDTTSGNSLNLQHFEAGSIAGAWEPEPYESQFIVKGKGTLVVDEASLWPGGAFPTTELVVTKNLLTQHPDIVSDLLRGLAASEAWINSNGTAAADAANAALSAVTGSKPLSTKVLELAWTHLHFQLDPLAADLATDAQHASALGLLKSTNLSGIVDLTPLNAVLRAQGLPPISDGGLGS